MNTEKADNELNDHNKETGRGQGGKAQRISDDGTTWRMEVTDQLIPAF
jgi:hypothetical protein